MSKTDKLKERLSYFIGKEEPSITLSLPNRVIAGFKLDNVADILKNVFYDKFGKEYKFISYEAINDGYLFNYILS